MRRLLAASLPAFLLACLAPGAVAPLRAADASDPERIVALPPFMVEEAGRGPPWRYAELPGFEVLARCDDRATRQVVQAYYQLHELLGLVLPESLRASFSEPRRLILYAEDLQPAASQEVFAQLLRGSERPPPREEFPSFGGRGGFRVAPPSSRVSFLPNLRLSDSDATYVFTIVREQDLNTDTLYLTPDYIGFLLKNRVPALPWWFVAGFLATYRDMTFRDGTITLKPLQWISEEQTAAVKKDPKTAAPPGPLGEFFRGTARREPSQTLAAQTWAAQGSLLVRWALDAPHPSRREALWKFVARASLGYSSEKTFAECFGFDFAAAQRQLAEFLPVAVRRTAYFELPGRPRPPEFRLRDAVPTEIARIKGDWERLEVDYVKERFPALAAKYLEQARRTLGRPIERDDREPRLLAALGLYACDAGDDEQAREYLEAAARHGDMRPRACYELARLRHAEALRRPAGADGKLSPSQAAAILGPLFTARSLNPPLAPAYRLIADVWTHCEFSATRAHLAVLDEGVALFPRDAELVYRTAALFLARGWPAEARNYVELGLQIAADDPARARFTELQSRLPAAPP